MGNIITNKKSEVEPLHFSNGAMSVLMNVVVLSASDAAETLWEKQFARWIAAHDQLTYGLGVVGFDVEEVPWSVDDFDTQKAFVLKTIEMALNEHRWKDLGYYPPFAKSYLQKFRALVEAFQKEYMLSTPSDRFEQTGGLILCEKHQVYRHDYGCILCNDEPIS